MIIDNTNNYNTPVRLINAKVELYEGSTLVDTFNQYYGIKEFTIERIGEGKFFGYGICQKLNIHLIDIERYFNITTANSFKVFLSTGGDYVSTFPTFYVSEVHRDENTNELSITAYDAIYKSSKDNISKLDLGSFTFLEDILYKIGAYFNGFKFVNISTDEYIFISGYNNGGNFEGTESVRYFLDSFAEVTQSIYYLDSNNVIVFKRLDKNSDAVFNIDKSKYITLKSGDNRRLAAICSATELGDNMTASLDITGTTQYVRDNPLWELQPDLNYLLDDALVVIGGLTINQFVCEWRGNPLLEIGDKISLTTKDNNIVSSYLLNDTLHYNGSLSQVSEWEYQENDTETESNPSNLGDALKQTFARVDKVNKQIDLVVSQTEDNKEQLVNLQLTTDDITASVQKVEETVTESLGNINGEITKINSKVEASITAEDLTIEVQNQLINGVSEVTTATGFTFNSDGLTVTKSGSEMSTRVTEDGMQVFRDEEAVLTANNIGVNATNLHATTYLIIGTNSRFEDFGENRTGCFWIGGHNS